MKTIAIIILIVGAIQSQSIYELTPGIKENQIVLQLSNISQSQSAENVEVKLIRQSSNIKFNTTEANIKNLNKKEEKEIAFSFDVNYVADILKQDTVEFLITDNKTIYQTKQFIFSYTSPREYRLEQNYPNPFNPSTKIRYTIPGNVETRHVVSLRIYDILGNEVATLVNEEKQPGYYEIDFNASNIASEVYIYRLVTGKFVSTKKMILLR
ncbi:MAG: T9SS type A sorting domain-containing protein [Ignavibacteriaceae bacterium]|nr:T9SS type A sorting domain-containing protein [Ignavibacteriaceae bacterium]